MAIVHEGCLKCPRCREYVVEADPDDFPDGLPEDGESPTACSECEPHVEAQKQARLRTIVADWQTVTDDEGCTISPDMLPVVITVPATSRDQALQAAADKLQKHFGPSVEALYETAIERDWWFGFNDTDPLLRPSAIFVGEPELDHDDSMTTVLR
ncbi:hypothetical protein [Streptomyces sp. NPDC057002]|uniref:hypothetical protein n=1 Tax=Streptomyces sp. NPDC057002 TaxID=3345992 RepID=UPI00362604F3